MNHRGVTSVARLPTGSNSAATNNNNINEFGPWAARPSLGNIGLRGAIVGGGGKFWKDSGVAY